MQKGDRRHYYVFSCREITFYGCNPNLSCVLFSPQGKKERAIKAKWKELLIGLLCLFLFASFPKCMIIRAQPLKLTILFNESNSKELAQVCIMIHRCFHQWMICIWLFCSIRPMHAARLLVLWCIHDIIWWFLFWEMSPLLPMTHQRCRGLCFKKLV